MKVIRPTNNQITGNYTNTHRGYDFAGVDLPDEVLAGMDGTVVEIANRWDKNWQANSPNDPFKPASGVRPLRVEDYGNYIKIKHTDGTIELHCHIKKDSMLAVGTKVKAGQVIARIGNTGNSTGKHLHSEFRNASNINVQVDFITNDPLQACLVAHKEAVESANKKDSVITELNKKMLEHQATEKRLIEEKDKAVRELEGKLQKVIAERDRYCQEKLDQQKRKIADSIDEIIRIATAIKK